MRLLLSLATAAALSGCAGKLQLLSDGKAYQGTYNTASKSLQVDVEGRIYRGNYILGQSFGIGQSFGTATGRRGSSFAQASAFSSSSSNQGRALLVSSDNQTLRCDIMVEGMSGQGVCQGSDGRIYDLIATMGQ